MRLLLSTVLSLALAPALFAADVYVVHGIDGTDLGQAQELLVDVNVNGANALAGVPFQGVAGPLTLPEGEQTLEVRLSDGAGTGTLVITARVDLALFETAVIVAQLDAAGTPVLRKYTVNNAPLADDELRISLAHGAQAPKVDITARGTQGTKGRLRVRGLANGEVSFPVTAGAGTYNVQIKAPGVKGPVAKLDDLPLAGNLLIVAVGSPANGTFNVLPVAIQPAD